MSIISKALKKVQEERIQETKKEEPKKEVREKVPSSSLPVPPVPKATLSSRHVDAWRKFQPHIIIGACALLLGIILLKALPPLTRTVSAPVAPTQVISVAAKEEVPAIQPEQKIEPQEAQKPASNVSEKIAEGFSAIGKLRAKSRLNLTGIMYSPTYPRAIINGNLVSEGDTVDGVSIIKIFPDKILLNLNGEEFYLELR